MEFALGGRPPRKVLLLPGIDGADAGEIADEEAVYGGEVDRRSTDDPSSSICPVPLTRLTSRFVGSGTLPRIKEFPMGRLGCLGGGGREEVPGEVCLFPVEPLSLIILQSENVAEFAPGEKLPRTVSSEYRSGDIGVPNPGDRAVDAGTVVK